MEKNNVPDNAIPQLLENITSNPDIIKNALQEEKEDTLVKSGNCEISCYPNSIKFKFVLCDVKIHIYKPINTEKPLTGEIVNTSEEESIKEQLPEDLNPEPKELPNATDENEHFQNELQIELQGKTKKLEEMKNILAEAKNIKERVDSLKSGLKLQNEKISEMEKALKEAQENKTSLQAIINERKKILETSSLGSKKFVDSYKNEIEYLKNNLNTIEQQIKKIEDSLKIEQNHREMLNIKMNEETRKLFEILSMHEE